MPIYEYGDPETGVTVELRRAVEDRNRPIVLTRTATVPDRVSIYGFEPSPEEDFDSKIVKALYRKEQERGTDFRGCGEFNKSALKKAWVK